MHVHTVLHQSIRAQQRLLLLLLLLLVVVVVVFVVVGGGGGFVCCLMHSCFPHKSGKVLGGGPIPPSVRLASYGTSTVMPHVPVPGTGTRNRSR